MLRVSGSARLGRGSFPPLGVVVASSLWLLLTHWGHSLPVVSWGSLLVLLGLSTLVRSLVLVAVRGWYFAASHGPAVARPAARHTSAAKAYLQKLRDGIEDQQNGEVL